MQVILIANSQKPDALAAAGDLAATLRRTGHEAPVLTDADCQTLAHYNPGLVVVLGGDGTILQVARYVACLSAPVVGINFGKLGYLAAFSMEQFKGHMDTVLAGRAPVTQRLMLRAAVYQADHSAMDSPDAPHAHALTGQPLYESLALNDVVINAGEPFRMIEMAVRINAHGTTRFRGDGLIVSTASGSTGYNLSAAGPLLSPDVNAMVLTPICPHSLSFRPVVLPDHASVVVTPHTANPGTRVSFDGQVGASLMADQAVEVRRAPVTLSLVENPDLSHWEMLAHKLHWAQSPRQ